jgi:hypothetical protein
MNLGRLLGAGKSFISGNNSTAYRADKRVYLPQFVSPKNPFANPVTTVSQAELPKPPSTNFAASVRTTRWASKLNPAAIFRADPASPNNVKPVQAELSLEKVKVVHNDLTDAEVEIVPMKSRPARGPAEDLPPTKKPWEVLGERIIKATVL